MPPRDGRGGIQRAHYYGTLNPPHYEHPVRGQLPPLAPLAPRDHTQAQLPPSRSSGRGLGAGSSSGSPRSSRGTNRSRAGCWTCRRRKVKCDEVHPRCGPCSRLSRDCDWDHRWNFNDATLTTQEKYLNINTTGNAVWDPQARSSVEPSPSRSSQDTLPAFAELTNEDERERKAELTRPGTYSVLVTPESFSDLPEYASTGTVSRRQSVQSQKSLRGSPDSTLSRALSIGDPNIVILERFEDATPPLPLPGQSTTKAPPPRRTSLPETMQHMSISRPRDGSMGQYIPASPAMADRGEARLIEHFRRYIVPRVIRPESEEEHVPPSMSTRDVFEREALRFPPLHHAMCAIAALNLSYRGLSSLEEAMQHYHLALASQTPASDPNELLSDGIFLRHFVLFCYDLCMPMNAEQGASNMWQEHLVHLSRISTQRYQRGKRGNPDLYVAMCVCTYDVYAGLMGSGECSFIQSMLQHNMLPPEWDKIVPAADSIPVDPYNSSSRQLFLAIQGWNLGITILGGKIAQTAHNLRLQAGRSNHPAPPELQARWKAHITQLQSELESDWHNACPPFLQFHGLVDEVAFKKLAPQVRLVFAHAYLLNEALHLYLLTSMYPRQRLSAATFAALTNHATRILHLTKLDLLLFSPQQHQQAPSSCPSNRTHLNVSPDNPHANHRYIIFALFMAGISCPHERGLQAQALHLVHQLESTAIGGNTRRVARLMRVVFKLQERGRWREDGIKIEDEWDGGEAELGGGVDGFCVDWIGVARERGLQVGNPGI